MGRDGKTMTQQNFKDVSTHAPAWGAIWLGRYLAKPMMFQLTRPHGARCMGVGLHVQDVVSTHAPAWGAIRAIASACTRLQFQLTRPHGARWQRPKIGEVRRFQLTRPHGARCPLLHHPNSTHGFQLTRPHGARCPLLHHPNSTHGFNSRARMGRDFKTHHFSPALCFNSRARMGRDEDIQDSITI